MISPGLLAWLQWCWPPRTNGASIIGHEKYEGLPDEWVDRSVRSPLSSKTCITMFNVTDEWHCIFHLVKSLYQLLARCLLLFQTHPWAMLCMTNPHLMLDPTMPFMSFGSWGDNRLSIVWCHLCLSLASACGVTAPSQPWDVIGVFSMHWKAALGRDMSRSVIYAAN